MLAKVRFNKLKNNLYLHICHLKKVFVEYEKLSFIDININNMSFKVVSSSFFEWNPTLVMRKLIIGIFCKIASQKNECITK